MTQMECTIRAFLESNGPKFPSKSFKRQVIINDLKNFVPRLFNGTSFANVSSLSQDWVSYI